MEVNQPQREFSGTLSGLNFASVTLGVILAVFFAAIGGYLALVSGMPLSVGIPAAIFSLMVLQAMFRRNHLLEHNIVQTIASTGGALASVMGFTIPTLLISGVWETIPFWPTTLLCICSGGLGVLFSVIISRSRISERSDLVFPEGVACARIIEGIGREKGDGGAIYLFSALVFGAIFKFFISGITALKSVLEFTGRAGSLPVYFGISLAPALLGIGYLVGGNIAFLLFSGSLATWLVAIPLHPGSPIIDSGVLTWFWEIWKTDGRYLGVGALFSIGLWTFLNAVLGLKNSLSRKPPETSPSLAATPQWLIFGISLLALFFTARHLEGRSSFAFITVFAVLGLGFLAALIANAGAGFLGNTFLPVVAIAIGTSLLGAGIFFLLGTLNAKALLAASLIATVTTAAALIASDFSQNLKTGAILGSSPKSQEVAKLIGVVAASLVIAPVLTILHVTYGIGTGQPDALKIPQATMIVDLLHRISHHESLPWNFLAVGCGLGVCFILFDETLRIRHSKVRLYPLAFAIGMYLPLMLTTTIFLGGALSLLAKEKSASSRGSLFASGLIGGEALMGVLLGVVVYFKGATSLIAAQPSTTFTLAALAGMTLLMLWISRRPNPAA